MCFFQCFPLILSTKCFNCTKFITNYPKEDLKAKMGLDKLTYHLLTFQIRFR